ncbi:MAG: amidohydrolase [Deltaproteobacteria bacterium]|jgi:amidohydrolase|nr:amidohydrolase [Deltaproteobacteria bacterium]
MLAEGRAKINRFIRAQGALHVDLALWLAQNPELGGEEQAASAKMAERLQAVGFEVERPYLGLPTAFRACRGSGGGPIVAFLAEYDALPGLGHACGHNLSGAVSLLAAEALAQVLDETGGQVRVYGTPAEETAGAKLEMARRGAFDGLALALMAHMSGGLSSPAYRSLAVTGWGFSFRGRGAHASAAPWRGRSALSGLRLFFAALDLMRPQLAPGFQMHGVVTSGGLAPNVVPETARAEFYFRAPAKAALEAAMASVFNCARGAAMATETEASWELTTDAFESMLPNAAGEEALGEIMAELGIAARPKLTPEGSSDVGEVSWRCPALQPLLDISGGRPASVHTAEFAELAGRPATAEAAVPLGAELLALAGLRVLTEPDFRRRLQESFETAKERARAAP